MEDCKDINGYNIAQYYFGVDGILYGVLNYENTQTSYNITLPYNGEGNLTHLSLECCTARGFTYDSNYGKCYHKLPDDTDLKIVFNVDGYSGLVFTQPTEETCTLNLKFDYLIEYLGEDLYNRSQLHGERISDILEELEFSLLIEKYVDISVAGEGTIIADNKTLVPVFEKPLYKIEGFGGTSGIILGGLHKAEVRAKLKSELGFSFYEEILDSPWLHASVLIEDEDTIQEITGQEVKFSLLIKNYVTDFSIIMDNIVMDKVCNKQWVETRAVDTAPSFNVLKVIDNKKAWVSGQPQRDYSLPIRETSYSITDERMVINSKEVEISTSIFDAIEQDMATFIMENTGLLDGAGAGDYTTLNITELMSTDIASLSHHSHVLKALATELVDVKSRKTLVNYPLLGLVYERYLTSELYLNGIESNKFSPTKLNGLVNMLGGYWADLIEQVVPSTTIWASINRVGTTTFTPNKFKYSRYNIVCGDENWGIETDMSETDVEVITTDTSQELPERQVCNNLQIAIFSDSSTGFGTVSVTGNTGENNTTTLNEG